MQQLRTRRDDPLVHAVHTTSQFRIDDLVRMDTEADDDHDNLYEGVIIARIARLRELTSRCLSQVTLDYLAVWARATRHSLLSGMTLSDFVDRHPAADPASATHDHPGTSTERQVVLLQDFAAAILCSTPSYALNIAEVAEEQGIDIKALPVRRGFFGAEPWSEEMRTELDRRLGITAVDVYGLSEIMGPGVACECDTARAGLHGWEDYFLFEIIDPETLEPLAMGETGELVITTLTKEALPMVRYRTRDITRLTDEPCACGRSHVRILRVTGRDDDMMIIRGVNVYPSQVEAVLVGLSGLSPHYQILLGHERAMDTMTVEVEIAADAPVGDDDLATKAQGVRHHIKSIIGVSCGVVAKRPGELPRSQGKAVRVRDLRKNQ